MDLTELRNRVMVECRQLPVQPSVDDVDDALNLVQREYLQPEAKLECVTSTTTQQDYEPEHIAISDLYQLRYVRDETDPRMPIVVDVLAAHDTLGRGVRYWSDVWVIQHMPRGRKLVFYYHKLLRDLGAGGVLTPDLPERWHDLLWLGAAATLGVAARQGQFLDRLEAFKTERWHGGRQPARMRARPLY